MSLNLRALALKRHFKFFHENDALAVAGIGPGGVVVNLPNVAGVNVLPDPTDAGWVDIGVVEEHEDKIVNEKSTDLRAGIPGTLVRYDRLTTIQDMQSVQTLSQVSAFVLENFYRSLANLTSASYQFAPLSSAPRKGWAAFVDYSHDNVQTILANIWCEIRITGGMKGGKGDPVMPELTVEWLYSACNTMAQGAP